MQTAEDVRVQVIFKPRQIAQIEQLRRRSPDLPSRAEMVRRLCDQAFAQQQPEGEARP